MKKKVMFLAALVFSNAALYCTETILNNEEVQQQEEATKVVEEATEDAQETRV